MYTEYVFDDKKYEVASKNLKSILFDVVNAESSKLADIREKIAEADESDLRSKMIELCDKHEKTLLSILNVSNELNETLQLVDSFSRDLRFLENESLAEIVSHYVEQQNASYVPKQENAVAAEQNASYIPEQENAVDPIMDANDAEKVEYNEVNDDSIVDVIARSTGSANESKIADQKIVEENNEEANIESPIVQEQAIVSQEESDLVSDANTVESSNDNTEIVDKEVAAPVIESSEPVFSVPEDDKKDDVITDIFGLNENGAAAVFDNPVIDESNNAVDSNVVEVSDNEQSEIQVQDSVIPVVNESVDESNDIPDDLSPIDATANSEITQDIIIPEINGTENTSDSSIEKQDETVSEVVTDSDGVVVDESEIITFVKSDNNQPRAILTTANQVSKLRASKGTNESLLTAKQFFKFNNQTETGESVIQPLSEKIENVDESTDSIVTEPVAVEDSNSVSLEQPVDGSNNNVIPFPIEKPKEEQMEEMMQQITELYNEGKVVEAQALSDKVSELNKELQQEQKVLVA